MTITKGNVVLNLLIRCTCYEFQLQNVIILNKTIMNWICILINYNNYTTQIAPDCQNQIGVTNLITMKIMVNRKNILYECNAIYWLFLNYITYLSNDL